VNTGGGLVRWDTNTKKWTATSAPATLGLGTVIDIEAASNDILYLLTSNGSLRCTKRLFEANMLLAVVALSNLPFFSPKAELLASFNTPSPRKLGRLLVRRPRILQETLSAISLLLVTVSVCIHFRLVLESYFLPNVFVCLPRCLRFLLLHPWSY
jgi:hypothetical protein